MVAGIWVGDFILGHFLAEEPLFSGFFFDALVGGGDSLFKLLPLVVELEELLIVLFAGRDAGPPERAGGALDVRKDARIDGDVADPLAHGDEQMIAATDETGGSG